MPKIKALPKSKQTKLGLYISAREAYLKWQARPDEVKILDVRTPEEHMFIGHPEMACNIPLAFQSYRWNEKNGGFALESNPEFIDLVTQWASPDDTILALCRSGIRSATAANMLEKAGYTRVYNITDGMEGDTIEDEENVFFGQRMKNGWKNSGSPWTCKTSPDQLRIPQKLLNKRF